MKGQSIVGSKLKPCGTGFLESDFSGDPVPLFFALQPFLPNTSGDQGVLFPPERRLHFNSSILENRDPEVLTYAHKLPPQRPPKRAALPYKNNAIIWQKTAITGAFRRNTEPLSFCSRSGWISTGLWTEKNLCSLFPEAALCGFLIW